MTTTKLVCCKLNWLAIYKKCLCATWNVTRKRVQFTIYIFFWECSVIKSCKFPQNCTLLDSLAHTTHTSVLYLIITKVKFLSVIYFLVHSPWSIPFETAIVFFAQSEKNVIYGTHQLSEKDMWQAWKLIFQKKGNLHHHFHLHLELNSG